MQFGSSLHKGEIGGLCQHRKPTHGVGMKVELEVAKTGHQGAQCDDPHRGAQENGGESFLEQDHRKNEIDKGRAPFDGPVHRDVHAVQGDEGEGGVEGKAEAAGQEFHALLQRIGRQLDQLQDTENIQEHHGDHHLAGHYEEGVVELVAGDHSLVEEIHANAAGEIEGCNQGSLARPICFFPKPLHGACCPAASFTFVTVSSLKRLSTV